MNDAVSGVKQGLALLDALDGLQDSELQAVIKRCQSLLSGREQDRRREALREIQRLAREHGLKVDVGETRRRGRPPKEKSVR